MPSPTPTIELVDVSFHYDIHPVLRGVDLAVQPGELLCVMGPNGSGKSTLLAVAAGMLPPRQGLVRIGGLVRRATTADEMAIRAQTVYLPADPWLPLAATGRAFLVEVARLYAVPDPRLFDHIERLLLLFNLTEKADSTIASYSTGQRKKIALAGALVADAKVMILDEPFAGGLDPSGILALRRVLTWMAGRADVTILMATPVPEIVESLAGRIAILQGGAILACDSLDALRGRAGCQGSLQEVFERIADPANFAHIEQYFEQDPAR